MSADTPNLLLQNPTPNDPATNGVWGAIENNGRTLVDDAVAGILTLSIAGSGTTILTTTAGAPDQARHAHFVFTGILTGASVVLFPQSLSRMFSILNSTTGAFTLTIGANNGSGVAAGTTIVVPQGKTYFFVSDGTNIAERLTGVNSAFSVGGALAVTGAATVGGGLAVTGALSATGTSTLAAVSASGNVNSGGILSAGTSVIPQGVSVAASAPAGNYPFAGADSDYRGYMLLLEWNGGDGYAIVMLDSAGTVRTVVSNNAAGNNNAFDTTNDVSSNSGQGVGFFVSGAQVFLQTKNNYTGGAVKLHRFGGV